MAWLANGSNDLLYWIVALAIIGFVEYNAFNGPAATQKPLGSVSGTIHFGLGLTVVLYLVAVVLN